MILASCQKVNVHMYVKSICTHIYSYNFLWFPAAFQQLTIRQGQVANFCRTQKYVYASTNGLTFKMTSCLFICAHLSYKRRTMELYYSNLVHERYVEYKLFLNGQLYIIHSFSPNRYTCTIVIPIPFPTTWMSSVKHLVSHIANHD